MTVEYRAVIGACGCGGCGAEIPDGTRCAHLKISNRRELVRCPSCRPVPPLLPARVVPLNGRTKPMTSIASEAARFAGGRRAGKSR